MKGHIHDSDEVFISPQQGWEQMQLLLDKTLPVNNRKSARAFYIHLLVAASLATIFLFSTLVLNKTTIIKSFNNGVTNAGINRIETGKRNIYQHALPSYSTKAQKERISSPHIINLKLASSSGLSSAPEDFAATQITPPVIIKKIAYQPVEKLPKELFNAKSLTIPLLKDYTDTDSTKVSIKVSNSHKKRTWNLSAGLSMNGMIGQQQNFWPYPVVVLRYNVSNKYFLSLGLAAGSHVSTQNRAVKKTVYVNDLVNNVQFYNAVNHYHDVAYADIPLLAGINISKNISLQAGLQASVLLKAKSKIDIEPYDFQMRLASGASSGFLIGTSAPVSETNYKVEERNLDYRFTSGIQYNINKLTINLMYQYSFNPVLIGDLTSGNKNQLVTFNVQFKIK